MYFSLNKILKNEDCKRIDVWDNELIVYKCGYVFTNFRNYGKWKLLNLNKKHNGYIQIKLKNKKKERRTFRLHRILYYAFNMERFNIYDTSTDNLIDHINCNPLDNRISNLRNVTQQHNQFNTKAKGYYFRKDINKYKAQIKIDGKVKYLGYFNTKWEARICYLLHKKYYHKINQM